MLGCTLFGTYTCTRRFGSATDHDSSSPRITSPLSHVAPPMRIVEPAARRCSICTPDTSRASARTRYLRNVRPSGSAATMESTSAVAMYFSPCTTAYGHSASSSLCSSRSLSSDPTGGLAMKLITSRTFCRSASFATPSFCSVGRNLGRSCRMSSTSPATVCSLRDSFRCASPSFSSRDMRYGSAWNGRGSSPVSKYATACSRVHPLILCRSMAMSSASSSDWISCSSSRLSGISLPRLLVL
mmetsp:Transcript_981/g.2553  ORF Transcript_981/g.2553 Transcript_981/m.2553 type:complete len:242 (-) Transcript_981:147-872(-)